VIAGDGWPVTAFDVDVELTERARRTRTSSCLGGAPRDVATSSFSSFRISVTVHSTSQSGATLVSAWTQSLLGEPVTKTVQR
jgi:hypothetical protein